MNPVALSPSQSFTVNEASVPLQIEGCRGLSPAFSLDDMRLLQLFTSKTADTLSDSPKVQETWGTVVVRLGFKHVQSNHFCILAASRKDAALHEFRLELKQVTADNCEALFAFSFLIGYYIPASAGTAINPSAHFLKDDFLGSVVEWMRLYLGAGIIHGHQREKIAKGPLNTFLCEWAHLQQACIDTNLEQRALFCILQLTSRARRYHSQYGFSPEECHQVQAEVNNEEIQANFQALKFLVIVFRNSGSFKSNHVDSTSECSFEKSNSLHSHIKANPDIQWLSLSISWLTQISSKFVDLIEQRHPVSLIIFAYLSVTLHKGPELWWNNQIPRRITEAIHSALHLEHRLWIKWPVQMILGSSFSQEIEESSNRILDLLLK